MDLQAHGVVAETLEIGAIAETEALVAQGAAESVFSAHELRYARAKADPARRLAARWAAKRAALRLLGPGFDWQDVAVERGPAGRPALALSQRARTRLTELGASRAVVSLTHGLTHAAAWVLFGS